MNKFIKSLLVCLILSLCTASCVAETVISMVVPDGGNFSMIDACMDTQGNFILTGSNNDTDSGVLLKISPDGQILSSLQSEATEHYNDYGDVDCIAADTYIALRCVIDDDAYLFVDCIHNGAVIGTTEQISGAKHLKAVHDGFLVCGAPNTLPDSPQSVIIMKGLDGQTQWQISLDEILDFEGIAMSADGNSYVLYGSVLDRYYESDSLYEGDSSGFAVCVNAEGDILWRYDAKDVLTFVDAVFDDEGNLYFLGDNHYSGVIIKYSFPELLWQTEYSFETVEDGALYQIPGNMKNAVVLDDQIVFAASLSRFPGIRLVSMSFNGEVLNECQISTEGYGNSGSVKLFRQDHLLYLLVNGRIDSTDASVPFAELPYITLLQSIDMK